MNDITAYTYERAAAVVWDSVTHNDSEIDEILLRLEDNLDDYTFDHELTLNIILPDTWRGSAIHIIEDGEITDVMSVDSSMVSVNLLPNNQIYTIRLAD